MKTCKIIRLATNEIPFRAYNELCSRPGILVIPQSKKEKVNPEVLRHCRLVTVRKQGRKVNEFVRFKSYIGKVVTLRNVPMSVSGYKDFQDCNVLSVSQKRHLAFKENLWNLLFDHEEIFCVE